MTEKSGIERQVYCLLVAIFPSPASFVYCFILKSHGYWGAPQKIRQFELETLDFKPEGYSFHIISLICMMWQGVLWLPRKQSTNLSQGYPYILSQGFPNSWKVNNFRLERRKALRIIYPGTQHGNPRHESWLQCTNNMAHTSPLI